MKPAKKRTKTVRKATRAVTLLTRIEGLLSDVVDECAAIGVSLEKNVRALLRTAESSIAAAKDYFIAPAPAKVVRKPVKKVAAKARTKAKAKTKAAAVAKKRPAAAKRRAATTVAVARPRVIAPTPFVPPPAGATPSVITAH